MKQLVITDIIDAFSDDALSIGDRLIIVGFSRESLEKKFPKELLDTVVYGSSFLKFFQVNALKLVDNEGIPTEKLPADFINAFEDSPKTIGQRLTESGLSKDDLEQLFDPATQDLLVNGGEFTEFLIKNQKKLFGKIEQLALKEKSQNAPKP